MWEGDNIAPSSTVSGEGRAQPQPQTKGDLTNIKLAKNQLVLLEQIDGLRKTIDKQGEILMKLMEGLKLDTQVSVSMMPPSVNVREHDVAPGPATNGLQGYPETPSKSSRGKSRVSGEEQFALGDSDEEGDLGG